MTHAPSPPSEERTLYIHVLTGTAMCLGCTTTRREGELVVKDARTGVIVSCRRCSPRQVV